MFELIDLRADGKWTPTPLKTTSWQWWFDKNEVSRVVARPPQRALQYDVRVVGISTAATLTRLGERGGVALMGPITIFDKSALQALRRR